MHADNINNLSSHGGNEAMAGAIKYQAYGLR